MSNARKIAEFASTLGRKNLLINGSMRVWQRGSSGSLPLNEWTYTADRWVSDCYGAALSWAQGSTPTNSNNTAGSLVISGAASNTGFSVHQRIEAANSFFTYGKKLTVSGQLYKSGTASAIDLFLHRPTAKDNFGTTVAIGNKGTINHPGGGAWIEFSHTFDTACPIEVANGLALIISHTSLGSGVDVGFTNVQLEIGEEATEFEWCPYSDEVVQCQRYYEVGSEPLFYSDGIPTGGTAAYGSMVFKVVKRATPEVAGSGWSYYSSGTGTSFTPTFGGSQTMLTWTASGLTNWRGWAGTGSWTAKAEL